MTSDRRYTIGRGDQKYGPYTLEEVRSYVAQGSIAPTDLFWTEGMSGWKPVRDLLALGDSAGTLPAPPPPPLVSEAALKRPPSLHWAVVLLLGIVTFTFLFPVWTLVQAVWVRSIDPTSKGLKLLGIGIPVGLVAAFAIADTPYAGFEVLIRLAWMVIYLVAYFDMRATIETQYGIELGGIMTFFFNVLYFQYHLRKIAKGTHTRRTSAILAE